MERLWTKKENVFAVAFDGEETFTQKNKTTKKVINYSPSSMTGGGGGGGGGGGSR